jgi:hypothetical protein
LFDTFAVNSKTHHDENKLRKHCHAFAEWHVCEDFADNFSVSNIRLLAQTAVKHGAVLHLVVNPDNILADNLKLISQDGRKNIFVEFV